jgi:hypothetical protein
VHTLGAQRTEGSRKNEVHLGLQHLPYSPDLVPSDFHLFRLLRNHLGGKRFAEEAEAEVEKWLRQQSKDLYAACFDALIKRWDKCISFDGGYVKD